MTLNSTMYMWLASVYSVRQFEASTERTHDSVASVLFSNSRFIDVECICQLVIGNRGSACMQHVQKQS